MKRLRVSFRPLPTLGLLALLANPASAGEAIVIDHTCTDIAKVPTAWIGKASREFRLAYGHTSHGSQVVSGMEALRHVDPVLFAYGPRPGEGLLLLDRTPKGDLGNPDRTSWAQRTREFLRGDDRDVNVILWSWCGQVSTATEADIEAYLDLMAGLEAEFPGVRFIYMTGHLDGTGPDGNLHRRNEQIRDFCRRKGKTLFDFADIESWDPDGRTSYLEMGARDTCDYRDGRTRRNWASDWLADNPDHGIALPSSAAHTHPLNGALKGRAFWWMMARLAGWDGTT